MKRQFQINLEHFYIFNHLPLPSMLLICYSMIHNCICDSLNENQRSLHQWYFKKYCFEIFITKPDLSLVLCLSVEQ